MSQRSETVETWKLYVDGQWRTATGNGYFDSVDPFGNSVTTFVGVQGDARSYRNVLALPYALFMLFDRQARRAWATPGPWLSLLVALLVASPHILWLFQSDFLPFALTTKAFWSQRDSNSLIATTS